MCAHVYVVCVYAVCVCTRVCCVCVYLCVCAHVYVVCVCMCDAPYSPPHTSPTHCFPPYAPLPPPTPCCPAEKRVQMMALAEGHSQPMMDFMMQRLADNRRADKVVLAQVGEGREYLNKWGKGGSTGTGRGR